MSYSFFLQTSSHIAAKGHANKATGCDEGFYAVGMRYAHGGWYWTASSELHFTSEREI